MYDIVIKNGTIVAGDSKRKYVGDIGIKNKKIVKIADKLEDGNKNIDASGLI